MRDTTLLGGKHTSSSNNAPVSLVAIEIPGNPFYITDLDDIVYLNRTTRAIQSVSGTGFDLFTPYPGLSVPSISLTDQTIQDDLQITLSNQNEAWFQVLAANNYRDSIVTVWQAQVDVSADNPESYQFSAGGVTMYVGRLSGNLNVTREIATLNIKPHVVPFTVSIPYRMHDATTFKRMPPANKKLVWGYDQRTI